MAEPDNSWKSQLREYLAYDPETGVFRWVRKPGTQPLAGQEAGNIDPSGYRRICFRRRQVWAHRLAIWFAYGRWPKDSVDHINGNPSDNRICNLREVTHQANIQNIRRPNKTNTSGFLGVSRLKGKWFAQIRVSGRNVSLGRFSSAEAAHEAYLAAKRRLHKGCTI